MKEETADGKNASAAAARLEEVRRRIAEAAGQAGRRPQDITLIAVSKTFGPDAIRPVLKAGQRHFGENRVQEARDKWPALKEEFPDVVLHLIGPLQTNKVKHAVRLFDVIHTVDRPKLAAELAKEMEKRGRNLPVFVQVNTGAEPQKAGVLPEEADAFIREVREVYQLNLVGLMCIPPVNEPPGPHFALLAKIAARNGLEQLSMGMSGDFETAIGLGATHVRVGSAIFGPRG
jgi:hypothetical protein